MDQSQIISKMSEYIHISTVTLAEWLGSKLPRINEKWWQECVLENLSYYQRERIASENITSLKELDLAALLRITNKSWYELRSMFFLPQNERECVKAMIGVRNNWAHFTGNIPGKDAIESDLEVIYQFFQQFGASVDVCLGIERYIGDLKHSEIKPSQSSFSNATFLNKKEEVTNQQIEEKSMVFLRSDPTVKGMVYSVTEIEGIKKYEVFINGEIKTFYADQIVLESSSILYHEVDMEVLRSSMTSYQLKNPSMNTLYSLNAARIDFVPYQFRPALKMIKAEVPRVLIADSVGVGKTIEAGLILKEAQARSDIETVLVICPKPLVAERKWEIEMKRFDEDFIPVDGKNLRLIISDIDRDGVWPERFGKAIIPYSLFDKNLLYGNAYKKGKRNRHTNLGLLDLDPAPHFDMVIVDEAHHIRNRNTYAYEAVKYICDHADSVIFLTATPLQTGDEDLFTLLNVLRPDVILDQETFKMMARPNPHINKAAHIIRTESSNWTQEALRSLEEAASTQWGEAVISSNPVYKKTASMLSQTNMTREQRVQLISDVESLHSFYGMMNRTRRQDIQDFCIRRSYTVETAFTLRQKDLHHELLKFEATALATLHASKNVRFMMTTISRQAASCIFGLAPFIKAIIQRRFKQIWDDPEFDVEDFTLSDDEYSTFGDMAKRLIVLAENLPDDDPKFDALFEIIVEKQNQSNNKIIIFSTFKHTLAYLREKLDDSGLRIAQIDGSVKDDDRYDLRGRFELDKSDPNAIDILLFTEVGSEGLDYQFCNMMINYDLPWNPMRIEQRIGRIDRRGQQSEVVNIYNMITSDTIDAEIYKRCLLRIGIFEDSVGECSDILGEISRAIQKIVFDTSLTDEERKIKLELIADNEVRRIQELRRLEEEEKQLLGFNLSNYTMTKEIQEAENPWISPYAIQYMVEKYLASRIGTGKYVIGESQSKTLRLSVEARELLLEDFRKLPANRAAIYRSWERYLKNSKPNCAITFNSEYAEKNRQAFFITPIHPLAKQAAEYFESGDVFYVGTAINSPELNSGEYPFSIYAWEYFGYKHQSKLVSVCEDSNVQRELMEILQMAAIVPLDIEKYRPVWRELEVSHLKLWNTAKIEQNIDGQSACLFRIESLTNSFKSRERILQQQIVDAYEENILRMRRAELENAQIKYNNRIAELQQEAEKTDIHIRLLVNGVLFVEEA